MGSDGIIILIFTILKVAILFSILQYSSASRVKFGTSYWRVALVEKGSVRATQHNERQSLYDKSARNMISLRPMSTGFLDCNLHIYNHDVSCATHRDVDTLYPIHTASATISVLCKYA